MIKNILIVLAHPALERQSFCEALALAYQSSAQGAGHEVRLIRLARLSFDPILHEGYAGNQPLEPDIAEVQVQLLWAGHLVFIYPMWGYMIPALLKGFFERTFTPGFAYAAKSSNPLKRGLLGGKSARLIQTMGMPGLAYRLFYRAHGAKALKSMLKFCGITPVRIAYFGSIDTSDAGRKAYLEKTQELGRMGL
jgi:NAD(P)H dehydrogenase (quinone)